MKILISALLVMLLAGCGRTFHLEPESHHLKVLSDARQLTKAALVYESEKAKSDVGGLITIEKIFASDLGIDTAEIKEMIRKEEIIYIPPRMPIDQTAIITITVVDDYVGITRANLTTETYRKK